MNDAMQEAFELLLDQYWNIAFAEGRTKIPNGTKANEVLHKLRELFKQAALTSQQGWSDVRSVEWMGELEKKMFDRVAYQREYMRKWRAAKKAMLNK